MSQSTTDAIKQSVADLFADYHSFNSPHVEVLDEEPTPLEFMRFVARNRPFVVKGGAASWPAVQKWSSMYLAGALGFTKVNVAMTPYGNADAPLEREDGSLWFVKPYEQEMAFNQVLDHVITSEKYDGFQGPVLYAQTQNDNLRGEYERLFADVPKTIPFAKIALGKEPDAVNFWLGHLSSIALHKDPYENIYVQIRGRKHFTLLPPHASACVHTQPLPAATYTLDPQSHASEITASSLEAQLDEPAATVPFPAWDPDRPERRATKFSSLCQPFKVTLDPGDMLYLPALWFHKVAQSCGDQGFCCAVNYWFDMEYTGSFYPLCSFAKTVGDIANSSRP